MSDLIQNKVNKWDQNGDVRFREINRRINHLNDRLFHDYEPALGPGPNFIKRLGEWLDNIIEEDDQKILFELVPEIFYVGREELNVLYREAYHSIFAKWLIDQLGVDFASSTVLDKLNAEVADTWFCPFTDSLRINQFYHINNIPSRFNHRPDWKSLKEFGDVKSIRNYIVRNNIKRIVLLEDFIGNGNQVSSTAKYASTNFSDIPILVIPLIICPNGIDKITGITSSYPNVTVAPVVSVPKDCFVHEIETDIDSVFLKNVHALATRTYNRVDNNRVIDNDISPYGPFGWRKTGGIIVMHTNTPDNSLPLIHHTSETWKPLFKRHKRI